MELTIHQKNRLSPLQIAYFKKLQWKNKQESKGTPTMINADQNKRGFKQWEERTSISPFNRHLGHYKSLIVADGKCKDDNKDISNTIWNIIVRMINTALFTSISLSRWMKVVSIMIEKEKYNSKINRLRIIYKYAADYNLVLKLYWPKIKNRIAEKNSTLGKNQIRNRK